MLTILEALGFHRIHHVDHSFGWLLPFGSVARFDRGYWRRVRRSDFHDCTLTGSY